MKYRKEIDGLRAVAVLVVILFHAGIRPFDGGFVGVDVFFVISGYLITSLILEERRAGTFSIIGFYERRARRILPALFVVLLASSAFAWRWLLPGDLKLFSQSLIAVSTFLSNIYFYLRTGYFGSSFLFPLLHTWSLAVEEQYYLIFPLLLVAAWPLGARWLAGLVCALALGSLAAAQWASHGHQEFAFFSSPTRAWELLIGVLAALYLFERERDEKESTALAETLGVLGVLLIAYAIVAFNKDTPFPLFALLPTIATLLLIFFATPRTVVGRLLGSRILVGIGLISYSAYLWHEPIFLFTYELGFEDVSKVVFAGLGVISVGLAYVTWKFVEVPFRDKKRFSRKSIFVMAGAFTCGFIAFGLLGQVTNGFVERTAPGYLPRNYLRYAGQRVRAQTGLDGSRCIAAFATICRLTDFRNAKRVLLAGDSHSGDYTFEFHDYVVQEGLNGWQTSVGACEYLQSQAAKRNGECAKARSILEDAVDEKRFDQIILVGDFYASTGQSDDVTRDRDIESVMTLVRRMLDSGSEVIFFTPRYHLSRQPMRAAFTNHLDTVKVVHDRDAPEWQKNIALLNDRPLFRIFEEADVLVNLGCGNAECFNGHTPALLPLYEDTDHLTDYGAKLAFEKFLELKKTTNPFYH